MAIAEAVDERAGPVVPAILAVRFQKVPDFIFENYSRAKYNRYNFTNNSVYTNHFYLLTRHIY